MHVLNKTLIGRDKQLGELQNALSRHKHVLILGEEGSGKTTLIQEFKRRFHNSAQILISSQSDSFKDICLELIGQLYERRLLSKIPISLKIHPNISWDAARPHFAELRTVVLKNYFLKNAQGKNFIIIFDHVGKIKARFFFFLDALRDMAQLVLVARTTRKQKMGRLWMLLWGFEKIEVPPLNYKEARELVLHWIAVDNNGMNADDGWFHEIFNISFGNPQVLKNLYEQIRKQKNSAHPVNVQIADIDRKIGDFLKVK